MKDNINHGEENSNLLDPNVNDKLYANIRDIILEAKRRVAQTINRAIVIAYFEIGRLIYEDEQGGEYRADYGTKLMENLAEKLTGEFGRGFSIANLYNMKKFYTVFRNCQTMSDKLSWSHHTLLMRVDDEQARDFYMKEAEAEGWSVRELDRQINSMLFERLALSRDKEGVMILAQEGQVIEEPGDIIKDPYVLEFLGLPEKARYTEKELETALIDNLSDFLLELGKGFTFVARQKRITLEDEHFYIDLVFYNRLLKCFVLIDLKIGKLTHQDIGQMLMYVNLFDRDVKEPEEAPTVGIILCKDKKEIIARYTLPEDNTQIFTSRYQFYFPTEEELARKVGSMSAKLVTEYTERKKQ